MRTLLFFSLILLLSLNTFASDTGKAKVIMVRGKATKLLPGAKAASPIKKGELLPEDTSVVTQEKSIVRLSFEDKSSVNIGPNSKLIVSKMPKKKANMLNLLTGAIKSEVDKREQKKNSKNKMIVKTRSAVMGVRGTKFQTIYNPANKNTSLVTIEGKVAMVKRKETPPKIVEKVIEKPVENASTKVMEKVAVTKTPDEELAELDKVLDTSPETVEVTEGKFSGVGEAVEKPTEPVKIAPKQYDALAKSMNSTKKAEDVMKVTEEELSSDLAKSANAPRPGGYVDFETGLYVAPPVDSEIDQNTGTYKSDEIIGSVDEVTGDYVPPKGVELDAKKGFVIKQEEGEKVALADQERLKESIAKLNNEVKKQVVVNKMEKDEQTKSSWYSPERHILGVNIVPYSELLTVSNKDSGSKAEFYSQSANKFILSWGQQWSDSWITTLSFGSNNLSWEEPNDVNFYKDGEDGDFFSIGLLYQYNTSFKFSFDFVSETFFYIRPGFGTDNSLYASKDNMDYIRISTNYLLYDWKSLKVDINGGLKLFTKNEITVEDKVMNSETSGLFLGINGYYTYSNSLGVDFGGWLDRTVMNVENIEFSKFSFGTSANLIWKL